METSTWTDSRLTTTVVANRETCRETGLKAHYLKPVASAVVPPSLANRYAQSPLPIRKSKIWINASDGTLILDRTRVRTRMTELLRRFGLAGTAGGVTSPREQCLTCLKSPR